MTFLANEPLAKYTNVRIGGPADFLVVVKTLSELLAALDKAKEKKWPVFILGGGTNVLVSDSGFRGLVIKLALDELKIAGFRGQVKKQQSEVKKVYVSAAAGVLINRLVRFCLDKNLAGLENFLGQPGTVGGALYINAHNMSVGDLVGNHLFQAEILTLSGKVKTVSRDYFDFGYDQSRLQTSREILLSAVFELEEVPAQTGLWEKARQATAYRQDTQPAGGGSFGCTFRNLTVAQAAKLALPNSIRSAGYLIDQCGLKGRQIGQAKISEKHANFILNLGGATAADVKKLIDLAKIEVKEKFRVDLEEEIVLVGF